MTVDEAQALLKLLGWELTLDTESLMKLHGGPVWRITDALGSTYVIPCMEEGAIMDTVYIRAVSIIEWVTGRRDYRYDGGLEVVNE